MAHQLYPAQVVETELSSQLITSVDTSPFYTVDNSMKGIEKGASKKIITRGYTADKLEELEMGEGNTKTIEATYAEEVYDVICTQGNYIVHDEQLNEDSPVEDVLIMGLHEEFTNNVTKRVFKALSESSNIKNISYTTAPSFENFVDAVASFGEKTEGLFALVNTAMLAKLRKAMKADFVYDPSYIKNGYIGSICGVPIKHTDAVVSDDEIIVATNTAVTLFAKKDVELEDAREANIRKTTRFGRFYNIIALTDATKVVKIKKATA